MPDTLNWFVVIEREPLEGFDTIPPLVIGPFSSQEQAAAEANSDEGLVYSLITIDAKNDGYTAGEVFWTQEPPEGLRLLAPSNADVAGGGEW